MKANPETDGTPIKRGPGRPRVWKDPAEKARAYRQNHEALLMELQKQAGRARNFDTLATRIYSVDRWELIRLLTDHFRDVADSHDDTRPQWGRW